MCQLTSQRWPAAPTMSRTMPVPIVGKLKYGGLVEIAFGCTLGSLANDFSGGTVRPRRRDQEEPEGLRPAVIEAFHRLAQLRAQPK